MSADGPASAPTPLTDEQIYDAAARLAVPWPLCFAAFGPPGADRDRAREQIAALLEAERGRGG